MTTLTTKQAETLAKLRSMQPFKIEQGTERTIIRTGLNTHVLQNLKTMGLISCERIYLRGIVTADLVVLS